MPAPPISRLSDSILIGHLQTPLDDATVLTPSTPVRSGLRELRRGNYDQAPVVEDGTPIGFVLAQDLARGRGNVENYVHPILPHALASESSPLEDALPWLDETGFLFLLRGQTISGFVVPSDLNKQAGRSYLYLGLTALELRLADLVRVLSRERDPLGALAPTAANAVRKRLAARTAANVEADVVAELNLAHLFQFVGADAPLLARLRVSTPEEWEGLWKPVNELRKRIAHSVKPVLQSHDEIGPLRQVDWTIHSLLSRLGAMSAERRPPPDSCSADADTPE